ncbi:hypothetical protein BDK92_2622 [Micromonospora pisi]|uniref:Uncharacterized protein n=1 Tax=Micromonospora pisi TaxID=589240 RepID=A0A495JHR1_9ACTN|nr:DUF3085 domain-containing protein [Micromonospora pisi]RKR88311.1 hypothetical protein BDK92_2622 [Micromonospora pisi]
MITLLFPLDQALGLAEHALTAPDHVRSLTREEEGLPAVPALLWVKDDGTYLMSNGIPGPPADPGRPDAGQQVVYADGWGSGTRQELGHTDEIGGDDFVEHLELTQRFPDGRVLIDLLRAAARQRRPWLALVLEDLDTFRYAFPKPDTQGPAVNHGSPADPPRRPSANRRDIGGL